MYALEDYTVVRHVMAKLRRSSSNAGSVVASHHPGTPHDRQHAARPAHRHRPRVHRTDTARSGGSRTAATGPRIHRSRRSHELLRHARHRLVRDHDRGFKLARLVPDELIPGTLNVGHALPTVAQALIFIASSRSTRDARRDDRRPSLVGAWLGAGRCRAAAASRVQRAWAWRCWSRRRSFAAQISTCGPAGGDALALSRREARVGIVAQLRARRADDARHRPLRALPDPRQPARHEPDGRVPHHDGVVRVPDAGRGLCASYAARAYDLRAALGLALGGIPAVLLAAYVVKSLPLDLAALGRGCGRALRGDHAAAHGPAAGRLAQPVASL